MKAPNLATLKQGLSCDTRSFAPLVDSGLLWRDRFLITTKPLVQGVVPKYSSAEQLEAYAAPIVKAVYTEVLRVRAALAAADTISPVHVYSADGHQFLFTCATQTLACHTLKVWQGSIIDGISHL